MSIPTRMISPIGNSRSVNPVLSTKRGLTFIEVMVTLIIFSIGIVGIFKTFLISLDRMNYLTDRLMASLVLDDHISRMERILRTDRALPLQTLQKEKIQIGQRQLVFDQELKISGIEDYIDVFQIDLTLAWNEGGHQKKLARSAYINDLSINYP